MKRLKTFLWLGSGVSLVLLGLMVRDLEVVLMETTLSRFLSNVREKATKQGGRILESRHPQPADALHLVTVMIGTPPQKQTLAVSTLAGDTAVPCYTPCTDCDDEGNYIQPPFNRTESATFVQRQCPDNCVSPEAVCVDDSDLDSACYHNAVIEDSGSRTGVGRYDSYEVQDRVLVVETNGSNGNAKSAGKNRNGFPSEFNCLYGENEDSNTYNDQEGFLAMSTAPMSFLSQLHNNKVIHNKIFSLCFSDRSTTDEPFSPGESAGHVVLGGYNDIGLASPLVWALDSGYTSPQSSYGIEIRRIYLGVGGEPNKLRAAAMGAMSVVPIDTVPLTQTVDRAMRGQQQQQQQYPQQRGRSIQNSATNDYDHVDGTIGSVSIRTMQAETVLHESLQDSFLMAFRYLTDRDYDVNGMIGVTKESAPFLPTVFFQVKVRSGQNSGKRSVAVLVGCSLLLCLYQSSLTVLVCVPSFTVTMRPFLFPPLLLFFKNKTGSSEGSGRSHCDELSRFCWSTRLEEQVRRPFGDPTATLPFLR